ncbi:hypothetical protein [Dyella sp. C11]|uniref:hypothetical protein n=1 Tax=Dyella sp. C11 TaxID=2126991 RepID=UPI001300BAD4|nr:hypothetical protein [Dyella sp. C11]
MLLVLVVMAVAIAAMVLPLKYIANAMGAQRTGVWWIVLVLFLQYTVSQASEALVSNGLLAFVLTFLAGALVIQQALIIPFKRAMVVSVISSLVTIFVWLLLIKLVIGKATHVEAATMLLPSGLTGLA